MAIHVGIGGWIFAPWRGAFYPKGLRQASELQYASRRITSIEINATFYRTASRPSFRRWAAETPDDFVFSVKGPRFVTNRPLTEAAPALQRFFDSGVTELAAKLGPILWQLPPTKKFAPDDISAFLALLPREHEGRPIRHAIEVRHDSFRDPAFVALMRGANVPIVYADTDDYPSIADVTGDFVYARLMRSSEDEPAGYSAGALDEWAARVRDWAAGRQPKDLPYLSEPAAPARPRDCFVYFIAGAKVRAPAAAMALLDRLGEGTRNHRPKSP